MANDLFEFKRERWPLYIIGGIIAFCFILLFSGYGVLLSEETESVQPYEDGTTVDFGGVSVPGELLGDTFFRCTYFSGRGAVTKVSSRNDGTNQCAFITKLKRITELP